MRSGQTTLEYMITVSVISIAVMALVYTLLTPIYEGTGQIQRLIVARGLLDYTHAELK